MLGVLRFRGRHSACPRGVAFGLIRQAVPVPALWCSGCDRLAGVAARVRLHTVEGTRGAGGTTGRVCGGLKTRARARARCLCARGHTRAARAPPPPLSPPSSALTCALGDGARESAPVGHRRRPARVAGHAERQGGGRDAPPTGLGAHRRRWGRPVAVGGGRRSRGGVRRELRRAPPLA